MILDKLNYAGKLDAANKVMSHQGYLFVTIQSKVAQQNKKFVVPSCYTNTENIVIKKDIPLLL